MNVTVLIGDTKLLEMVIARGKRDCYPTRVFRPDFGVEVSSVARFAMAVLKSHLVAGFVAYLNSDYSWTNSDLGLGMDDATSIRLKTAGTHEVEGAIYDSVYVVRWSTDFTNAGFDDFRAIFGGINLSEGSDGLIGGTVTGIHYQAKHNGEWTSLYDLVHVSAAANFVNPMDLGGSFGWVLENWLLDEDDRISLTRAADDVSGFAGDDRILGKGGADTLRGGDGKDVIFGGAGNDIIFGDSGYDRLFGQSGNDKLYARSGADIVNGGSGRDRIFIGGDQDRDRVVFQKASDSAADAADRVFGFTTGEDVLDFRRFDGDVTAANRQALVFSATGPMKNALWTEVQGADLHLLADVTGDTVADFKLILENTVSLSAGDLLL